MIPDDPTDDPRVLETVREYLAELEAGQVPDRRKYLDRYPDLAEAIEECLDGVELAHAVGQAVRPAPRPPAAEFSAEPLGDFRIVREVGRGGMGVVYEAVQLSLGRRVALKVLPFASALDAKHLQRFRAESHAAAQLHHSNIVPVYAVGCERGVHFYAMQLIDGRPVDAVIRDLRGEAGGPARGESTADLPGAPTLPAAAASVGVTSRGGRGREAYRTAARIAEQVADALEYAHDAGVIHRDVKPANLLLDGKGTVWVTDFGLAHMPANAGMTRTGDLVGTLRYMSPEQAAGRRLVDHRTDVYSLGATLYELLTLQPIFPGEDRQALLHQILTEEPRRPRLVDRGVPPELETIVLKAVTKAPEDRYPTAGEMAADLRRFLDDRPVLARRPSLFDRGRKWLRRHPAYVGAAVLVLVFAVLGLAAFGVLAAREKDRTAAALDREKQRAAEAEDRFQLARRSADEMIRIADEELADDLGQQTLRRRLLESALMYYQELIELRRGDPDAQEELKATRTRVEAILADLAVIRGAERHMLLAAKDVQDDLGLTDDQRARVGAVVRGIGPPRRDPFRDWPRTARKEWSDRLLAEMRAHETAIEDILSRDQLDRLRQIALQVHWQSTFRDPDVVKRLGLTREQQQKLRDLGWGPRGFFVGFQDEGKGPRGRGKGPPPWGEGERPHGPGPGDVFRPGPPWGPDFDPQARRDKALDVLTPEQQARWRELTGEPFHGNLLPPFRPPATVPEP